MENLTQDPGPALGAERLVKRYGRRSVLRGLDLEVPRGSIFGLLGPNGAGKSTTLKVVLNLLPANGGRSSVLGTDSRRLAPRDFERIGYVSPDQRLPERLTVDGVVEYCRPFYPSWDDDLCARLLAQLELPGRRRIKALSRGMKMKLRLLLALAFRPQVLVADELFSGLDPLVRDQLKAGLLAEAEPGGFTVLLTSHEMEDVEPLVDRVGFLVGGRVVESDELGTLQERWRRIDGRLPAGARLPAARPDSWLLLEHEELGSPGAPDQDGAAGAPEARASRVRFLHRDFDRAGGERAIRARWPELEDVRVTSLSLRDLFIAVARSQAGETEA